MCDAAVKTYDIALEELVAIILSIPLGTLCIEKCAANRKIVDCIGCLCESKRKIRKTSILRKGKLKSSEEFLLLTNM